jgi:hypothetical protein
VCKEFEVFFKEKESLMRRLEFKARLFAFLEKDPEWLEIRDRWIKIHLEGGERKTGKKVDRSFLFNYLNARVLPVLYKGDL